MTAVITALNTKGYNIIGYNLAGLHSGVSGTTATTPMQLPFSVVSRVRPLRGAASHAHGANVRSTGQMAVRPARVRHVGGFRRPVVYGVHFEPVHDQRRPLLGHYAPARLRR